MCSSILYGQSSLHCIPLGESRVIHERALKSIRMDTIIHEQGLKIELLTQQNGKQRSDFEKLIGIEQNKFQLQKEISDHTSKLSESYRDQLAYISKKERKQRIQNRFLKAGVTIAAGFIVYQGVK